MTDLRNEARKATRLLQEKEYEFLTAMGLKLDEEPNEAQRVAVLRELYEVVKHSTNPELQEALKTAQSLSGNYPHPIDAMAMLPYNDTQGQLRAFATLTYQPHVMRVKRPPLRD